MCRLLGVSRVALPDGHAPNIIGVRADAGHILNPCAFELVPGGPGPEIQIYSHSAGPQRRFVFDDWIIPMIDRIDSDHRLRLPCADGSARIITGPFAERSVVSRLLARRRNLSLDGDLRMRWYRQSGNRSFDDVQRPSAQAADKIQFGSAPRNLGIGSHKGERILTEGSRD